MNSFRDLIKRRIALDIGLLVVAAGLLMLPVCMNGIPTGNDFAEHYRFALAFNENLREGSLYPSWSGHVNHGFGDVGIRFYPPLSYYVMNGFRAITGDWYIASVLTFFSLFFIGGIGVYLWAREWFDETASLVAGILYMVMPYHANQLFNAFFLAEFAAASVVPYCFLYITRVIRKPDITNILLLGLSYAALILTHLPTTLIASAGLFVYGVIVLFSSSERVKTFISCAAGVGFGLLLSSFYWIKLITETPFVNHASAEFAARDFDFRSNFLFSYFYVSGGEYLNRSLWFADIMLLMTVLASVPAAIVYFSARKQKGRREVAGIMAVFALALFFATPLSSFIWASVPLLAKIQFPFRWMALATLAAVMFVAAGARLVLGIFGGKRRALALLVMGGVALAVAFTAFQVIRPSRYVAKESFTPSIERILNSESCECWWPIWADRSAFKNREFVTANGSETLATSRSNTAISFNTAYGPQTTARIAVFYYPHWKAEVNGSSATVRPADDGTILLELPAGEADVRLFFEEPWATKLAGFLSAAAFAVFLGVLIFVTGRSA